LRLKNAWKTRLAEPTGEVVSTLVRRVLIIWTGGDKFKKGGIVDKFRPTLTLVCFSLSRERAQQDKLPLYIQGLTVANRRNPTRQPLRLARQIRCARQPTQGR